MYENANGVEKNLEIALMWYVAAARQGDVAAREKSKYLTEIIAKERQS
jgi:TPR repeat protein